MKMHVQLVLKVIYNPNPIIFLSLFLQAYVHRSCLAFLAEYTSENPKIVTKCSHHFHLGCIYEWMERSENCPVCGKVSSFSFSVHSQNIYAFGFICLCDRYSQTEKSPYKEVPFCFPMSLCAGDGIQ